MRLCVCVHASVYVLVYMTLYIYEEIIVLLRRKIPQVIYEQGRTFYGDAQEGLVLLFTIASDQQPVFPALGSGSVGPKSID